ncbi:MAG: phosphotransferase [Phycisphaeraceae bacterium]|nr:phosphotransferase [Phycisphaeraceae bacterium]
MSQDPTPTSLPNTEELGVHAPSGTGSVTGARVDSHGRELFDPHELAMVLSHYDVGIIEAIEDFPRGSRKAPKLIIRSSEGLFLLKRRARGKDDPFKVAFCHGLQMFLSERRFPLPHLIGTKAENNSMLQFRGRIYELFEFIKGTSYDNSLEATAESGHTLALFHKLLLGYEPDYEPPRGCYHAARSVVSSLKLIPQTLERLNRVEPSPISAGELAQTLAFLEKSYTDAARKVNEIGMTDWPMQIVHSDWHPGNMLFRKSKVVAVIDYDAARLQQRVTDIANGALQFSILGGGDDPETWPDYIDEGRYKRFLRAYDHTPGAVISRAELRTIPWLMIEALVAEAAIPIAATGNFGRMEGIGILRMVERKVRWLIEHADRLASHLDE